MNKLRVTSYELRITSVVYVLLTGSVALLLTACGGGPPAQPTAIPASVARPQQASPDLVKAQPVFGEVNASPTVIITPESEAAIAAQSEPEVIGTTTPIPLQFQLPPSALGIATGGTSIVDQPGGTVLATVPAGGTLTVSGKSADGKFLAVYDNNGISGWVTVGSLKLFGADDLTVLDQPISPGPIATMMAEAMLPPVTSALQAAMTEMMKVTPISAETPQP